MAIAFNEATKRAVASARSQLGYRESGTNRNKFGAAYGWNGVAWCVQFAWWVHAMNGSDGGVPKTASTGAAMRWAKSVGRWRTTPQPGDYSIMVNSKGATIHTDVVESYKNGRLICIGGNTSGTYKGSVNNGDGVYRNDRTAAWKRGRIIGFVRPLAGVTRADVRAIQKAAGITQDGVYGPKTLAGTKRVQKQLGVKADGFPGPSTMAALEGGATAKLDETTAKPVSKPVSKPVEKPTTASKPKTVKAPAFPLPRKSGALFYYGKAGGPIESVSGKGRNSKVPGDVVKDGNGRWYSKGLKKWQAQMLKRGWKQLKVADGRFGDDTETVVGQFQKVMGLTVDHRIGPDTWSAAWTEPVK